MVKHGEGTGRDLSLAVKWYSSSAQRQHLLELRETVPYAAGMRDQWVHRRRPSSRELTNISQLDRGPRQRCGQSQRGVTSDHLRGL